MGGGVAARAGASESTSTAPAAPRVTSTSPTPESLRRRAAATTGARSPAAARFSSSTPSSPASWPSSRPLGFMTSGAEAGNASPRASSGASEVSTAMPASGLASRTARTQVAQKSTGTPGGREPASTTHDAPGAWWDRRSRTRSASACESSAPGVFSFVVVPSSSTMVRFTRASSGKSMASCGMFVSASRREKRPLFAAGYSASVSWPALATAADTLTPLPPGTSDSMARR